MAYRRMVEPGVVEVNADDAVDQVLRRVIDLLQYHSILPPSSSPPPPSSSTAASD